MQTNNPTNGAQPTVAVVGAGISGLSCARTLADHGRPVTVFEKSRGVGGRMATRRSDNGVMFDHGAQYFTVRDERFQNCVDSWQHAGVVQRWTGRIVSLHGLDTEQDKSSTARFVGCPGMNAICRHLAENLDVRTNTRVAPPTRCQGKWLVSDETDNELGRYDVVIVSAPAPQAGELLQGSPDLASRASSVKMAGCWALLVRFPARIDVDYDGAFVQDSALSWIARNSSKPGRNSDLGTWMLHASAELHEKYASQGLAILGFPCNQFLGQEPGSAEEIQAFCQKNYGVTFDMFAKVEVNGENACELYKFLTSLETEPKGAGKISWNFEKFLIDRNGMVIARFGSGTKPNDPAVLAIIERELSAKPAQP
jgi:predicted NAD/FAD-dependent oxidoreductase